MNPFDYGKGVKTKLIAWKAKMDDLTRRVAKRESKEKEKTLGNSRELTMPIREMSTGIEPLNKEPPAEWTSKMKTLDNGFADMRGRYVLRPRLSWTGLYGKEPWPRERNQWEKV